MLIGLAVGAASYNSEGVVQAEFLVKCTDTDFAVYFNKTALNERTVSNYNNRSYTINFESQSSSTCMTTFEESSKVDSNFGSTLNPSVIFPASVHIGATYATDMCGIQLLEDATYVYYNATIVVTYGSNNGQNIIDREEKDYYYASCIRNRTVEEKLNGVDHFNTSYRQTGAESQNTTLDFDLTLSHTDASNVLQASYKIGDFIKFKMVANTASPVVSVIQSCKAVSSSQISFDLIKTRCDLEYGTSWVTAEGANKTSVFQTEAFRFVGANEQVFVECIVRVCLATNTDAECTLCSGTKTRRRRREISEEEKGDPSDYKTIRSPVFYIIDNDAGKSANQQSGSEKSMISGTNATILIVLVAVFVLIVCAAIIKKVFFTAALATGAPVVAYHNKAMA